MKFHFPCVIQSSAGPFTFMSSESPVASKTHIRGSVIGGKDYVVFVRSRIRVFSRVSV